MGARQMREGTKKQFARQLRAEMTEAEQHLWKRIRGRQLADCRFRRQHCVGSFIADFACLEKGLIIEVDGSQHNSSNDSRRDAYLLSNGYRVLRFWNNEVLNRTGDVLAAILEEVEVTGPHPGLPPQAGEGENVCRS